MPRVKPTTTYTERTPTTTSWSNTSRIDINWLWNITEPIWIADFYPWQSTYPTAFTPRTKPTTLWT